MDYVVSLEQIVGPSYYVYNYYLIDDNEYCPNVSDKITKMFALAYYSIICEDEFVLEFIKYYDMAIW